MVAIEVTSISTHPALRTFSMLSLKHYHTHTRTKNRANDIHSQWVHVKGKQSPTQKGLTLGEGPRAWSAKATGPQQCQECHNNQQQAPSEGRGVWLGVVRETRQSWVQADTVKEHSQDTTSIHVEKTRQCCAECVEIYIKYRRVGSFCGHKVQQIFDILSGTKCVQLISRWMIAGSEHNGLQWYVIPNCFHSQKSLTLGVLWKFPPIRYSIRCYLHLALAAHGHIYIALPGEESS